MLNATFQSHPIKMGCCSTNEKSLIVTTINPIWRSPPVHPGTKKLQFIALKARKTLSLHTIFTFRKPQTNQATCCLDFQSSIFFLSLGLDTLFQLLSILTLIIKRTVSQL